MNATIHDILYESLIPTGAKVRKWEIHRASMREREQKRPTTEVAVKLKSPPDPSGSLFERDDDGVLLELDAANERIDSLRLGIRRVLEKRYPLDEEAARFELQRVFDADTQRALLLWPARGGE